MIGNESNITLNATPENYQSQSEVTTVKYAGFWIRLVANIIDIVIAYLLSLISAPAIAFVFGAISLIGFKFDNILFFLLPPYVVFFGYFIVLTYKKEATWGKMALGLRVVPSEKEKLSLGQVVLRETIGKIISAIILCIGFIMAGFTEKKEALHDKIAKTNVVYKDPAKKSNVRIWVIVIILFGIIGIAIVAYFYSTKGKFDVSVPQKPNEVESKVENENIFIKKEGAEISMQIQNYTQKNQPPYPPLGVWVNIKSLEKNLSLNPAKIFLSVDGKGKIVSSVYLGPSNSWESPRSLGKGCGPQRHSWGYALSKVDIYFGEMKNGNPAKSLYLTKDSKSVTVSGENCFMFFFNVADTSPNHQFSVSVEGLAEKDVPVIIPEVSFQKGTVTKTTLWP
jgi:uncharacterized RDD family membrane protein YckC